MSGVKIETPNIGAEDWKQWADKTENTLRGFDGTAFVEFEGKNNTPQIAEGSMVEIKGNYYVFRTTENVFGFDNYKDSNSELFIRYFFVDEAKTFIGAELTDEKPIWWADRNGFYSPGGKYRYANIGIEKIPMGEELDTFEISEYMFSGGDEIRKNFVFGGTGGNKNIIADGNYVVGSFSVGSSSYTISVGEGLDFPGLKKEYTIPRTIGDAEVNNGGIAWDGNLWAVYASRDTSDPLRVRVFEGFTDNQLAQYTLTGSDRLSGDMAVIVIDNHLFVRRRDGFVYTIYNIDNLSTSETNYPDYTFYTPTPLEIIGQAGNYWLSSTEKRSLRIVDKDSFQVVNTAFLDMPLRTNERMWLPELYGINHGHRGKVMFDGTNVVQYWVPYHSSSNYRPHNEGDQDEDIAFRTRYKSGWRMFGLTRYNKFYLDGRIKRLQ